MPEMIPKGASLTCSHPACNYTWTNRVAAPKKCPRCLRWLEQYPPKVSKEK